MKFWGELPMTDIKKLQEEELNSLSVDTEVLDLESLITDGVNAKVPVEITYKGKTYGAILKPLVPINQTEQLNSIGSDSIGLPYSSKVS